MANDINLPYKLFYNNMEVADITRKLPINASSH